MHLIKFKRGSDGFQKHKPYKATLFALNPLTQAWPVLRNETQSLPFFTPNTLQREGHRLPSLFPHSLRNFQKERVWGQSLGVGEGMGTCLIASFVIAKNILLSCIFTWGGGASVGGTYERMRAEVPKWPRGYYHFFHSPLWQECFVPSRIYTNDIFRVF